MKDRFKRAGIQTFPPSIFDGHPGKTVDAKEY
jgi:hypothetical protein